VDRPPGHSKALAEAGVNITLISAGKYKTEGHPYGPLDAEAQRFFQKRTDDYYATFTKAVAKGRGVPIEQRARGHGPGPRARRRRRAGREDGRRRQDLLDVVRNMQRAQAGAAPGPLGRPTAMNDLLAL
jgi:hypothetical protein